MTETKNNLNAAQMSSLAMLWAKAQPSVMAFVRASIRNPHDCEDVVQATIEYIVEHFDEYDSQRPFIAWAIGVARYRVLDYRHHHRRDQRLVADSTVQQLATAYSEMHEGVADARREALRDCIGQLPSKSQGVLLRRYYEGVSVADISKHLGLGANAMSAFLRRIRISLSKCIEKRLHIEGEL